MNNYETYYNYPNSNNNVNNKFAEPYTAFIRGNLFNNLYNQYKNYRPSEVSPANEKDYNLLMVQIYDFCAHEMTLYLDNYPNDTVALNLRDKYSNLAKEARNQYESKYGALSLSSNTLAKSWNWDDGKWPWEGNK